MVLSDRELISQSEWIQGLKTNVWENLLGDLAGAKVTHEILEELVNMAVSTAGADVAHALGIMEEEYRNVGSFGERLRENGLNTLMMKGMRRVSEGGVRLARFVEEVNPRNVAMGVGAGVAVVGVGVIASHSGSLSALLGQAGVLFGAVGDVQKSRSYVGPEWFKTIDREAFNAPRRLSSSILREGLNLDNLEPKKAQADATIRWNQAERFVSDWCHYPNIHNLHFVERINMFLRGIDPQKARERDEACQARDDLWNNLTNRKENTPLSEEATGSYYRAGQHAHSLSEHAVYREKKVSFGCMRNGRMIEGETLHASDAKRGLPAVFDYLKNEEIHPIIRAAKLWQDLVTLHVFIDGNGRTARLAMDAFLMSQGYLPPHGQLILVGNAWKFIDRSGVIDPADEVVPLSRAFHAVMDGIYEARDYLQDQKIRYDLPDMSPFAKMTETEVDQQTLIPATLSD